MASDKGYPSKERETSREVYHEHVTSQPVREKQWAKDVISHIAISEIGTDAVEANSTTSVINASAHIARVGDVIKFTSGALVDREVKVLKVLTNSIEIGELLPSAPATADTFTIFRHTYLQSDSNGSLNVNAVQTPVKFNLNGSEVEVTEDTVTPANNRPLPVKLTGLDGDVMINSSNLNLAVQLDHDSANPDSVRIGDGTNLLAINASNEAKVIDTGAHTKLDAANASLDAIEADTASLDTKIIKADTDDVTITSSALPTGAATESTLSSLLTELQLKADLSETQPVSAASLPLPVGASTEAKQDDAITELQSLVAKDFATQTTLAALLTELQLKADLTETQPVSAASLPLPTGAATESTLNSLLTELQLKADLSETQPVSAVSLPLPSGAATEAKQNDAITELQDILSELVLIKNEETLDVLFFDRHDYSVTPVTTSAYTELIASTSDDIKEMQIFDSSGQTLVIAIGAASSEVDKLYVFPGGNGNIKARIPALSRISIKAVSATANAGEISINFLG